MTCRKKKFIPRGSKNNLSAIILPVGEMVPSGKGWVLGSHVHFQMLKKIVVFSGTIKHRKLYRVNKLTRI